MTSGKPSVFGELDRLGQRARDAALGDVEADLAHRVLEQLTVLGHLDGLDRRADQLHVVFVERAGRREIHREVQRRLPADGRQQRIRPLALDDRREDFRREGLDVRPVGQLGIGHDRRRIAVDENHLQPFGAHRLARLAAGVVELARLPDDDGAGADDEDALQICTTRHG